MTAQTNDLVDRLQWSFGDRVRKARRVLGYSQAEMAQTLDVEPTTLSAWETGRTTPRNLFALARRLELATGIPAPWMLGREPGPAPTGPGGAAPLPIAAGCSDLVALVQRTEMQAVADAVTKVLAQRVDVNHVVEASVAASNGVYPADANGRLVIWAIIAGMGHDVDALGVPLPSYIEKDRLAEQVREAVFEECTRRDSNPKPSDPKFTGSVESLDSARRRRAQKFTGAPERRAA